MWPKVMSSWTRLWVVSWASDNVCLFLSLPLSSSFTGHSPSVSLPCPCLDSSLCLHAQLHLSSYLAPHLLVVIPSASLLWLRPRPLMLRGGHSMPLMWPWPHVPPACLADPGAVGPSSTLGDWWQGCPLLSPSTPQPRLGGQHSVSWAHLCGAQELHLKRRHHSCLVPPRLPGGHRACVTSLPACNPISTGPSSTLTVSSLSPCSIPLTARLRLLVNTLEYLFTLLLNVHTNKLILTCHQYKMYRCISLC